MNQPASEPLPPEAGVVGLKTVFNILDQWGCTAEQAWSILGMKKSTYYKYRNNPGSASLTPDQLERISYILNMHQALRVTFDNPANVKGFVSMANHNPYFNGRTPLEVMSSGRFGDLYETYKRLDALRGAGL